MIILINTLIITIIITTIIIILDSSHSRQPSHATALAVAMALVRHACLKVYMYIS